jgi:hypothetical protein
MRQQRRNRIRAGPAQDTVLISGSTKCGVFDHCSATVASVGLYMQMYAKLIIIGVAARKRVQPRLSSE